MRTSGAAALGNDAKVVFDIQKSRQRFREKLNALQDVLAKKRRASSESTGRAGSASPRATVPPEVLQASAHSACPESLYHSATQQQWYRLSQSPPAATSEFYVKPKMPQSAESVAGARSQSRDSVQSSTSLLHDASPPPLRASTMNPRIFFDGDDDLLDLRAGGNRGAQRAASRSRSRTPALQKTESTSNRLAESSSLSPRRGFVLHMADAPFDAWNTVEPHRLTQSAHSQPAVPVPLSDARLHHGLGDRAISPQHPPRLQPHTRLRSCSVPDVDQRRQVLAESRALQAMLSSKGAPPLSGLHHLAVSADKHVVESIRRQRDVEDLKRHRTASAANRRLQSRRLEAEARHRLRHQRHNSEGELHSKSKGSATIDAQLVVAPRSRSVSVPGLNASLDVPQGPSVYEQILREEHAPQQHIFPSAIPKAAAVVAPRSVSASHYRDAATISSFLQPRQGQNTVRNNIEKSRQRNLSAVRSASARGVPRQPTAGVRLTAPTRIVSAVARAEPPLRDDRSSSADRWLSPPQNERRSPQCAHASTDSGELDSNGARRVSLSPQAAQSSPPKPDTSRASQRRSVSRSEFADAGRTPPRADGAAISMQYLSPEALRTHNSVLGGRKTRRGEDDLLSGSNVAQESMASTAAPKVSVAERDPNRMQPAVYSSIEKRPRFSLRQLYGADDSHNLSEAAVPRSSGAGATVQPMWPSSRTLSNNSAPTIRTDESRWPRAAFHRADDAEANAMLERINEMRRLMSA